MLNYHGQVEKNSEKLQSISIVFELMFQFWHTLEVPKKETIIILLRSIILIISTDLCIPLLSIGINWSKWWCILFLLLSLFLVSLIELLLKSGLLLLFSIISSVFLQVWFSKMYAWSHELFTTEVPRKNSSLTGGAYDFGRATTSLTQKLLSSSKKVTLVRHGYSTWNKEGRVQVCFLSLVYGLVLYLTVFALPT